MSKHSHIGNRIKEELDKFRKRENVDASDLIQKYNISRSKFYNVMRQPIPNEHDVALFSIIFDVNFISLLPQENQELAYEEKKFLLKKFKMDMSTNIAFSEPEEQYGHNRQQNVLDLDVLEQLKNEMRQMEEKLKKMENENNFLKNQLIDRQNELLQIIKKQ